MTEPLQGFVHSTESFGSVGSAIQAILGAKRRHYGQRRRTVAADRLLD